MTRDQQLRLIWRHAHRDYRGVSAGGTKLVLRLRNGGTCLVALDDLTEQEIAREMASIEKIQAAHAAHAASLDQQQTEVAA